MNIKGYNTRLTEVLVMYEGDHFMRNILNQYSGRETGFYGNRLY